VKWIKEYQFDNDLLRVSLDYLIGLYEYLTSKLIEITREVILLARSKKYITNGQTAPSNISPALLAKGG